MAGGWWRMSIRIPIPIPIPRYVICCDWVMSESTKIGDGLMLRCSDAPHLLVSLLNVVVEESFCANFHSVAEQEALKLAAVHHCV